MNIHPLADVKSKSIGEGTTIWQFVVILEGAVIGKGCNINCNTLIENDVVIGNNVTIKTGANIWDAIRIEDDVFVGPGVVFANDPYPRNKQRVKYPTTLVKKGASLGSNTTILPGLTIGRHAMTGAGSLVTKDVPDYALVYGNPAKWHAWIDETGKKMKLVEPCIWVSENGNRFREVNKILIKI